jgi:hypothetical protein
LREEDTEEVGTGVEAMEVAGFMEGAHPTGEGDSTGAADFMAEAMGATVVGTEVITGDTTAGITADEAIIVPTMAVGTTLMAMAASGLQDTGHKFATPGDAEPSGFRGTIGK